VDGYPDDIANEELLLFFCFDVFEIGSVLITVWLKLRGCSFLRSFIVNFVDLLDFCKLLENSLDRLLI